MHADNINLICVIANCNHVLDFSNLNRMYVQLFYSLLARSKILLYYFCTLIIVNY